MENVAAMKINDFIHFIIMRTRACNQNRPARKTHATIKNSSLQHTHPRRYMLREEISLDSESRAGKVKLEIHLRSKRGASTQKCSFAFYKYTRRNQHQESRGCICSKHQRALMAESERRVSAYFSRKLWRINQMSGTRARLCESRREISPASQHCNNKCARLALSFK